MNSQILVWTTLPRGIDDGQLSLSVLVSPRLIADTETTLIDFPDLGDWPAMAVDLNVEVGGQLAANPTRINDVRDSALWQALFHAETLVRPFALSDHSKDTCSSYAFDQVVGFLASQYGKFAVDFPEEYPTWEALIDDDAFGCLGFSKRGSVDEPGPTRRARLLGSLTDDLAAYRYVPRSSVRADPCDELGRRFLELYEFHQPDGVVPTDRPLNRRYDFHEVITFLLSHHELLRRLGLIIDLRADLPDPLPNPSEPVGVRVIPVWEPTSTVTSGNVTPFTKCHVDGGQFYAVARGASADFADGHFRLGRADMFATAVVDPDGGALQAMALADAIQISRTFTDETSATKRTLTTPDRYALPSLRTGGIQVSRIELAGLLIGAFDTGTLVLGDIAAATAAQQADPKSPPTGPDLYAEDLVRGGRWDVYDELAGEWRSLMDRRVTYQVTDGPQVVIERDEAAAIIAPTKSSSTPPGAPANLKMSEAKVRWNGWSLAVPPLGSTIDEADQLKDKTGNLPEANIPLSITAALLPEGGFLPRLRFGRTYRLRARTVDLAGNGVPFAQGATTGSPELVSPTIRYGRFEPVAHPPVLLRSPRGEGESPEVVAIRSEGPSSPIGDAAPAERHVVPPQTSAHMAERLGRFDLAAQGKPLNASAYITIKTRDESSLLGKPTAAAAVAHPAAQAEPGQPLDANGLPASFTYDVDDVDVTWLADPFARGALLRGLPPATGSGSTETQVPFDDGQGDDAWPAYEAFRLILSGSDSSTWELSRQLLTVALAKGDIFRPRVSSHLTGDDVDKLALLQWVERYVASLPITEREKVDRVRVFRQLATDGRCYMVTPYRELTLVHAVRTPLIAPTITPMVQRDLGDTFARIFNFNRQQNGDLFSRKSTGTIDVDGRWAMPIDDGTNEDPVTPQEFASAAFTLRVERANGPEPDKYKFNERHEFGDTKYRKVTYNATATTAFTEFFVEHVNDLALPTGAPTAIADRPVEPTTIKIRDHDDPTNVYRQGTDYTVDGPGGTVTAKVDIPGTVDVDFVAAEIHATGPDAPPLDVPNSAPPAAPSVLYAVPTFEWDHPLPVRGNVTTERKGGGLRVYLDRPWWSSGDGERLAVLFDPDPNGNEAPSTDLAPYITLSGFDPAYKSVPASWLLPKNLPLRNLAEEGNYPLAERPNVTVAVAPHAVAFDASRRLWFCDIQIDDPSGSYQPMVRLALARFQYHSLPGAHLSPVVVADFVQLSPTRRATIVRQASTGLLGGVPYAVTVRGTSYGSTSAAAGPAIMTATVERHRDDLTEDPDLAWEPVGQSTVLTASFPDAANSARAQWTGEVKRPLLPPGRTYRLVLEELEVHYTGDEFALSGDAKPFGRRLVHTDIIPLT